VRASAVLRACQRAQWLGLVDWSERRVRCGWCWLRISKSYRFVMPTSDVVVLVNLRFGSRRVRKVAAAITTATS
jgi:hypothetical protein